MHKGMLVRQGLQTILTETILIGIILPEEVYSYTVVPHLLPEATTKEIITIDKARKEVIQKEAIPMQ
jgi:hypothetical protein